MAWEAVLAKRTRTVQDRRQALVVKAGDARRAELARYAAEDGSDVLYEGKCDAGMEAD